MSEPTAVKASKFRTTLIPCTANNKEIMKLLVHNCFPLTYKEEFYEKIVRSYKDLTRFITMNDIIVGGIVARVEIDEETHEPSVHILVLLVLEKYRRCGLASVLMKWILDEIRRQRMKAKYVQLHVQKANEAAVKFYIKNGFRVVEELKDYYTNVENSDALFMRMDL